MRRKIFYCWQLVKAIFLSTTLLSQVTKVESVGITVREMDRSLKFYTEVLGFKKISDNEYKGENWEKLQGVFGLNMRVVKLQLGDEFIELTDYITTGGRSIPEDAKSNDLFFQHIAIVVSDMEKAYAQLKKYNVEHVSTSPQTLPKSIPAAEGIKAFYFHDPDNHNLELIYFPKGKGQEKWQKSNAHQNDAVGMGKLFLGIDHTAIGVSSTESSHQFYMNLLGIERKGDSWNKGIEQEHLNNIQGASLHITGYRSAAGPGIEFLQYINPGPGKAYPTDSRTHDIWHWQTSVIVDDAEKLYNKLKEAATKFISDELVSQQTDNVKTKSFIVRDPDGHAVLIKEILK